MFRRDKHQPLQQQTPAWFIEHIVTALAQCTARELVSSTYPNVDRSGQYARDYASQVWVRDADHAHWQFAYPLHMHTFVATYLSEAYLYDQAFQPQNAPPL